MKLLSPSAIFLAATLAASAAPLDDARALIKAGKLDEGIAQLEAASRASGKGRSAFAVELAQAQVAAGRLISAQQTAERFLREAPATDPKRNAMALLNARLREACGDPAEAISLYRTIAEQT